MPRGPSKDAKKFREFLEKAVILVGGETESTIEIDDADPVFVAIVVDVNGYGPHVGAIYAQQNRFHGNADAVLEGAYEILEEWTRDHYPTDDDDETFETFDGQTWQLSVEDFAEAIEGTAATKYIEIDPGDGEEIDHED